MFNALKSLRDKLPNWIPVWLFLFLTGLLSILAPWALFIVAMVLTCFTAYRMAFVAIYSIVGATYVRKWEHTHWRAEYEQHRTPDSLAWDDVLHVVIIATYNETLEILRQTLENLSIQGLAHDQLAIVLAFEADEPTAKQKAAVLEDQYGRYFKYFFAALRVKDFL